MASDQLRKKWGTIFMGEREATPQQLDAMQEPVLRERMQHQQQEDYLARVRARAEERAREILGAAYAERQKVLEEARTEAEARVRQLTEESHALKARAQAELAEAEAERGRASDLRQEAEDIRQAAHAEGFQAGMDQAGEELKEFRAEVGGMVANLLRGVAAQRGSLTEDWRAELAELTRVAVEAGTGWVLESEHKRILQHLVFTSLQLLEDRATVNIRVHPDDEETVSDLFRAARERVPELSQWIVNGDEALEPGDLVAESLSGSVENLRAHYREMVEGILEHLTLPQAPGEKQAGEAAEAVAQRELEHLAALEPQAVPQAVEAAPEVLAESPETQVPEPKATAADAAANAATDAAANGGAPLSASSETGSEPGPENGPTDPAAPEGPMPAAAQAATPASDAFSEAPAEASVAASPAASPETVAEPFAAPSPHAGAAPSHAQAPSNAPAPSAPESAPEPPMATPQPSVAEPAAAPLAPEAAPAHDAARQGAPNPHGDNPSLAELEDELFPLPEEADAAATNEAANIFVNGGFLPGSGDGRTE